ncbi:glutathione S-transferase family protein [Variovorax sp. PCZ-1]|uniref:glutathione S-transferase family protein n=1 Tax=Variovorax sp. PCZ-1 TaxID=2835533 RepID=UPI0032DEE7B5
MSETLTLWGRISSINVRKVMWTAQYLNLPIQRIDAGAAFGVINTPEFQQMNPNAMIPVLNDGDYTLWESNVIVRYLCEKYSNGALYPSDTKQRFDAERWMDWQQSELNRASALPFAQWVRTAPEQRNHVLIKEHTRKMHHWLGIVEAHLAKQPYMAGNSLTMADIPLLSEVHRWWAVRARSGETSPAYPAIERWYAPLLAHPASKGVFDLPVS